MNSRTLMVRQRLSERCHTRKRRFRTSVSTCLDDIEAAEAL